VIRVFENPRALVEYTFSFRAHASLLKNLK